MPSLEPIQQALTHVEAHLRAPCPVADMAAAAGYSLYHFCRVFGQATRHSPHDYLIRRRMTAAGAEIVESQRNVIDIALDYQFESHAGFTRAFGRIFGASPSAVREQQVLPPLRGLSPLTAVHLDCLKVNQGLTPQVVARSDWEPELNGRFPRPTSAAPLPERGSWAIDLPFAPPANPIYPHLAGFRLHTPRRMLSTVIDWVLHSWLFYAPYTLSQAQLWLLETDGQDTLWLPVYAQR